MAKRAPEPTDDTENRTEFERFEELARKVVAVPKREAEELREELRRK